MKTICLWVAVALIPFTGAIGQQNNQPYKGITAHRGNSSAYPENTMAAFRSALEAGVDWIECDVYKTRDGRLVVIHDADTGRVADRTVELGNISYDELAKIDIASAFRTLRNLDLRNCPVAHVPLLVDVLALVMGQKKTKLSIQPKDKSTRDILKLVKEMNAEEWVGFNDSDLMKMQQVKRFDKTIPVFWDRPSGAGIKMDLRMAIRFGFESIVMNEKGISQGQIEAIHEAGLEAGAWTVNNVERMEELLNMGIDRIYTDNPYRLIRIISKRNR